MPFLQMLFQASGSTSKVVSIGERLPRCTWFRHFQPAQGKDTGEEAMLQDSRGAILLQRKHPLSAGKGSKHIHVRFCFTVGKTANKELRLICCPVEELVADCNCKQKLFVEHRNTTFSFTFAPWIHNCYPN